MADFAQAYLKVARWEGGYVNHAADGGGETIRGVARVYHEDWAGWAIVDREKNAGGGFVTRINRNEEIRLLAIKFFETKFWRRYGIEGYPKVLPGGLGIINDQSIAEIMFDWSVLTSPPRAWSFAKRLGAEGQTDINNLSPSKRKAFFEDFKDLREAHHRNRVKKKPSQAVFLEGWLNRNDFYTYTPSNGASPAKDTQTPGVAAYAIPGGMVAGGIALTLIAHR